jgi:hypothetical protein
MPEFYRWTGLSILDVFVVVLPFTSVATKGIAFGPVVTFAVAFQLPFASEVTVWPPTVIVAHLFTVPVNCIGPPAFCPLKRFRLSKLDPVTLVSICSRIRLPATEISVPRRIRKTQAAAEAAQFSSSEPPLASQANSL